ncbi:MAG TPA: dienelactone hydrolase family protein [Steroidobacteraceae bacterium]|jgi:carboxymethylenebutenolidase|nr:dienelactone hydrolase family protein [Steroidobacteraceae bacterium]
MSEEPNTISRREFTALSIAAGVAAATGASGATAKEMIDSDVQISTPAGVCDAALVHPRDGSWPAAILFTDVFGLRPTMRDMARRLAADGYTVLVPNPFYRTSKPPGLPIDLDFNSPADRAKMDVLRKPLTSDAVMQDATAYVKFLDSQPSVNNKAKMGAFGYCMGGPMTMQAAAANPHRIGAGASFHGGGLVTDKPDSPHSLVPKMKAQYYFGIAMNDDERQPEAKVTLDDAFKAAKLPAKIEVYDGCLHGWCVKDMPAANGKTIYNEAQAERAWGELVRLFKRALV